LKTDWPPLPIRFGVPASARQTGSNTNPLDHADRIVDPRFMSLQEKDRSRIYVRAEQPAIDSGQPISPNGLIGAVECGPA
jgi:hypothetical protein